MPYTKRRHTNPALGVLLELEIFRVRAPHHTNSVTFSALGVLLELETCRVREIQGTTKQKKTSPRLFVIVRVK